MLQIFKYFWFICAIVGIMNICIFRLKLKNEKVDSKIFKSLAIFFIAPYILLGIFELLGGYDNCFYIFSNDYKNIFLLFSWLTLAVTWIIPFFWIVFRNGARKLIEYRQVLLGDTSYSNENETLLKVKVTLFLIILALVLIFCAKMNLYNIVKAQLK